MRTEGWMIATFVIFVLGFLLMGRHFERKKRDARELMLYAILMALAVASRLVFAWLPHMKPIEALCMLYGAVFGWRVGFLTGSLSIFLSNFAFGQGPWTPWQMVAYGLGAMVFGWIYHKPLRKKRDRWRKEDRPISPWYYVGMAAVAFVLYMGFVGPILDTSVIFTTQAVWTKQSIMAMYMAGVPVNFTQGLMSILTIVLIGPLLVDKLDTISRKYGIGSEAQTEA